MPKTQRSRSADKPLVCAECKMLHFSLIYFRKEWLCPSCLNGDDYGPKHIEMADKVYASGALDWVN